MAADSLPMGRHPLLRGYKRHVSPRELAEILGMGHTTIYRKIDQGLIKAHRPEGSAHYRISRAEAVRLEKEWVPE